LGVRAAGGGVAVAKRMAREVAEEQEAAKRPSK